MNEPTTVALATAGAVAWLWAWHQFAPRPEDRQLDFEFIERPPAWLVFVSFSLFVMVPTLVALGIGIPKDLADEDKVRRMLAASVASGPIVVAGVLLSMSAARLPWWMIGITRQGWRSATVEGFRVVWEWLPLVVCVNVLVRMVFPKEVEQINSVEKVLLAQPPLDLALWAAAAAVLRAPIVEELVFRGLFQSWFNMFTAWPAILSASIVFAAVHSSAWPDPIPLVLVGVMLGLAFQRTRNLLAPIVAHALFNGVMTAVALLYH